MANHYPTIGLETYDEYVRELNHLRHTYTEYVKKTEASVPLKFEEAHCYCPHPYDPESFGTGCECCLGYCAHMQQLRVVEHRGWGYDAPYVVAEEYVLVEDRKMGRNIVHIAIYERGKRPPLTTYVLGAVPQPQQSAA